MKIEANPSISLICISILRLEAEQLPTSRLPTLEQRQIPGYAAKHAP